MVDDLHEESLKRVEAKKADSLKVVLKADIAENDPMTIDLSVPTATDLLTGAVAIVVETDLLTEVAATEVEIVLLIAAAETEAAVTDLHTEATVAEIAHLTEAVVEIDRAAAVIVLPIVAAAEADLAVVADSVVAAVADLAEAEDFAVVVAVAQVAAVATAAEIVPREDHEINSQFLFESKQQFKKI